MPRPLLVVHEELERCVGFVEDGQGVLDGRRRRMGAEVERDLDLLDRLRASVLVASGRSRHRPGTRRLPRRSRRGRTRRSRDRGSRDRRAPLRWTPDAVRTSCAGRALARRADEDRSAGVRSGGRRGASSARRGGGAAGPAGVRSRLRPAAAAASRHGRSLRTSSARSAEPEPTTPSRSMVISAWFGRSRAGSA